LLSIVEFFVAKEQKSQTWARELRQIPWWEVCGQKIKKCCIDMINKIDFLKLFVWFFAVPYRHCVGVSVEYYMNTYTLII